jgi:hypothetical protein
VSDWFTRLAARRAWQAGGRPNRFPQLPPKASIGFEPENVARGSSGVAMIWSLQVLRFLAALMVVYVHAAQIAFVATTSSGFIPHNIAIMGRAGVDIFLCFPAS